MKTLRRFWPQSLRWQLIVGVTAVVSFVLIAVGTVSVLILRSYVNNMIDSGNVIAEFRDGRVTDAIVFAGGESKPVPPEVRRDIEAQSWQDSAAKTVQLGTWGTYRMQGQQLPDGDLLVSGVSLDQANAAVTQKTVVTGALIVVALLVTAVGTFAVVQYALRPLRRVAATAAKVATSPLADDHRITVRVRDIDTNPGNEVGLVGETLNRLLTNVDSALTQLAQADRRMRQFLADASHELRTPLTAIQGYAELTRQDSSDLPPMTEYALARIEAESRRMSSLVEELLLLSRLDEGHDLQTDVVDLVDLAIDAVNDAAVSGPEHHWVTELPNDPVWIRGDRARLHQLLSNLLSNARFHTPAGVTVTTAITTQPAEGYLELSVTDDGPDIDAELLPHLFDRFVRADKARSHDSGNLGLGLAIVASIAEAHHGSVTAESANGRTTFTVRLPMIADLTADSAAEMARSHA